MQKSALGAPKYECQQADFSRGRDSWCKAWEWQIRMVEEGCWVVAFPHNTGMRGGILWDRQEWGKVFTFLPWGPSLSSLKFHYHYTCCREINHSFLLYCLYANALNKSGLRQENRAQVMWFAKGKLNTKRLEELKHQQEMMRQRFIMAGAGSTRGQEPEPPWGKWSHGWAAW